MNQLPPEFVAWMREQLGDELPAFLRAYEEAPWRGLRLNPLKPLQEHIPIPGLLERIPWEESGYYLAADSRAGAMVLHEAGAYYLQEPSAMLPVAALDPQPGESVLDLCAAPGGKSTQIAGRMQGRGLLVCNEPIPKRAQVLSRNLERMGVPYALVVNEMPPFLAEKWPEGFDAVLVDAPCSGEGMFRRHPETVAEWSPAHREGCARRQAEILDNAAKLVRTGGRMVYATCTLNRWENEETVNAFLQRHPEFAPEPFTVPGAGTTQCMFTCYPHRMKGEGQFAARLRKQGIGAAQLPQDTSLPRPDRQQLDALRAFSAHTPVPTAVLGGTLVSLPHCPDVRGIHVLRVGLHLGMMKGRMFQPDHAWAMSNKAPFFSRVPLTEVQAARYQSGETLPVDESLHGFVLPTYGGLPLGWGKVSDGVMKNHYPKGLRR